MDLDTTVTYNLALNCAASIFVTPPILNGYYMNVQHSCYSAFSPNLATELYFTTAFRRTTLVTNFPESFSFFFVIFTTLINFSAKMMFQIATPQESIPATQSVRNILCFFSNASWYVVYRCHGISVTVIATW